MIVIRGAQISRIAQDRIDYERKAPVIGAHLKADLPRTLKDIPARHLLLDTPDLLVEARPLEANFPAQLAHYQVALGVQFKIVPAFNTQTNGLWVCARRHHKVILELPLVAVINQIHAGVDVPVAYFCVSGNLCLPPSRIVSDQIVDETWQPLCSRNLGRGIGRDKFHTDHSREVFS